MNKNIKTFIFLGIIFLHFSFPCNAQTMNWPQFRGINCSGIASENAKLPIEFNEKNLIWKTVIPAGHSSPCIWGDNIFLTGCVKDENKLEMFCINRLNGKTNWQHSLSPEKLEKLHAVGNAAQSSPTTDGERVYFYFGSYGLLCYDVYGQFLWEKKFPLTKANYGVSSSPILYKNMLLLCRDVKSEARLYALNKVTGDPIWVADLPKRPYKYEYSSYSTPVIWQGNIVTHRCMQSTAHSLKDGSLTWLIELPTNGNSTPVINNDIIYFGAWHEFSEEEQRGELPDFETMIARYDIDHDGFIKKQEIPVEMLVFERPEIRDVESPFRLRRLFNGFDKNKDGLCDSVEWNSSVAFWRSYFAEGGLFALKPDSSAELQPATTIWKAKEKVPEVPSPLYYKNMVYMCKNGGILTCMDAEKGTVLFQERIGAAGPYLASPVAANGYIYFPSGNGIITVIKAGRKLNIVKQSDLNEKIYATPAIVGNKMYFRSANSLYAFGDKL